MSLLLLPSKTQFFFITWNFLGLLGIRLSFFFFGSYVFWLGILAPPCLCPIQLLLFLAGLHLMIAYKRVIPGFFSICWVGRRPALRFKMDFFFSLPWRRGAFFPIERPLLWIFFLSSTWSVLIQSVKVFFFFSYLFSETFLPRWNLLLFLDFLCVNGFFSVWPDPEVSVDFFFPPRRLFYLIFSWNPSVIWLAFRDLSRWGEAPFLILRTAFCLPAFLYPKCPTGPFDLLNPPLPIPTPIVLPVFLGQFMFFFNQAVTRNQVLVLPVHFFFFFFLLLFFSCGPDFERRGDPFFPFIFSFTSPIHHSLCGGNGQGVFLHSSSVPPCPECALQSATEQPQAPPLDSHFLATRRTFPPFWHKCTAPVLDSPLLNFRSVRWLRACFAKHHAHFGISVTDLISSSD